MGTARKKATRKRTAAAKTTTRARKAAPKKAAQRKAAPARKAAPKAKAPAAKKAARSRGPKAVRRSRGGNRKAHEREPGSLEPKRESREHFDGAKWFRRGPPVVQLDPDDVFELSRQGLSQRSIALLLRVGTATLERRLREDESIREAFDAGRAAIELDVLQAQRAALRDTPADRIWAGKQFCGQRDVKAVEVSGPDGGPIQTEVIPLIAQKLQEIIRARSGADQHRADREVSGDEEPVTPDG